MNDITQLIQRLRDATSRDAQRATHRMTKEQWTVLLDAADTIEAQAREIEALRADAMRYRWLAGHCRSTSEHWGGRWSIVVEGPSPKTHDSEDDFDAAIDAALAGKAVTP